MKGRKITTVILVIILVAGVSLLLYPSVSNWWNSYHSSQVVTQYNDTVKKMKEEEYQKMWKDAIAHNKKIWEEGQDFYPTDEELAAYNKLLSPTDDMVIGYIDIEKINVSLQIYHGASDLHLSEGIGHLEWSSLPTGGKNTHCVLSGHRGLPSAKLFTDLDKLKKGDVFTLNILNETLTYEVDQIRTVLPEKVSDLTIVKDKDYCTLVTCTPYGINTHRLLVRGHRIQNLYDSRVVNEVVIMDPIIVAGSMAVIILVCILSIFLGKTNTRKRRNRKLIAKYRLFR